VVLQAEKTGTAVTKVKIDRAGELLVSVPSGATATNRANADEFALLLQILHSWRISIFLKDFPSTTAESECRISAGRPCADRASPPYCYSKYFANLLRSREMLAHPSVFVRAVVFAACAAACGWSLSAGEGVVGTAKPSATVMSYSAPGGDDYFALSLKAGGTSEAPAPTDHVIIVDSSASQTGAFRTQALAVLDAFLES
jgi:hypothetical protein